MCSGQGDKMSSSVQSQLANLSDDQLQEELRDASQHPLVQEVAKRVKQLPFYAGVGGLAGWLLSSYFIESNERAKRLSAERPFFYRFGTSANTL